ncbi:MAG: LysR family transcriptional regulator [Roseivivax sp.]|nr:LysR family transcriptional regulator [Roseivivax sp.]
MAFRDVAETRRIGLASERIHLSQPAITQAIAKLEATFGARLFDRRPDGMYQTETGAILYRRVVRLLDHLRLGAQLALRRAPRAEGGRGRREFYKLVKPVQLQALVAIANAESYSQAARDLGARQPALHRAARELQELAGIALFEPNRRGVSLTPSALALALHTRLAMSELRQARYEIDAQRGQDSTRIVVGSLPMSRTAILPAAIDALLSGAGEGPQVQCIDAPFRTLLRDLRHGEIDFILGALRHPLPADDVMQEVLFTDSLSIVARPGHPLAGVAPRTLADTLAFPWIAPPKDTPSGTYLFETLRIQDMAKTPVRIVSSSLVLVRGLMSRGDYVTIMSRNQYALEEAQGLLTPLPIPLPDSARPIGLITRAGWQPTATQARLLDLIRDYCRAAFPDGDTL